MDCQWTVSGLSVDCQWTVSGLSVDYEYCCQGPGVLGPGSGTSDADGPAIGYVMTKIPRPDASSLFRFMVFTEMHSFISQNKCHLIALNVLTSARRPSAFPT